ncbi:GFA family protein [Salipiger aestuarii]|uniref:GFA family protein n=1 Tax=Salipiger aestuarii TaxID=568098 RepID=UPI00123AA70A|nr:GFA family protein [Salipiger aestuarii]
MAGLTGRCLCEAVAYGLTGKPARTTICCCRFCQRATGGAQLILPVAPMSDFHLTRGGAASYTHVSEGSGKAVHLHFCRDCGTRLYMTYARWPDMVGLFGGTLDNPTVVRFDPTTTKQMGWMAPAPGVAMRHTAGVRICN